MRGVIMGDIMPAHWRQRLGRFREVPLWNAGLVVNALRAEPSTVFFSPSTLIVDFHANLTHYFHLDLTHPFA